jgi:hypothetical protein
VSGRSQAIRVQCGDLFSGQPGSALLSQAINGSKKSMSVFLNAMKTVVCVVPILTGLTLLDGQMLSAKELQEKCFKLEQHSIVSGDLEIIINATNLKVLFKKSHTVILAKAPDWAAYKYNLDTKKYCIIPAAKFTNTVAMTRGVMGGTSFSDVPIQKVGPSPYRKFTQMVYSTGPTHYPKGLKLYRTKEVTGDYPNSMSVNGLVTENCAKEEIKMLTTIYSLPKIPEVPIDSSSSGFDGKHRVYLSTSSLEEVPVTPITFAAPDNFKKVAVEAKLNEDNEFNENFIEFMNTETKKR